MSCSLRVTPSIFAFPFQKPVNFSIASTGFATNSFLKFYFINYTSIIDLIRNKENNPISNTYRLFLLFIGCEKVEHKPRVSWDIEGVLFSTVSRNHLKIEEFKKLCNQDSHDLENYCIAYIKNKAIYNNKSFVRFKTCRKLKIKIKDNILNIDAFNLY